ncbi:hypothetical protein SAMN04490192_2522 [Pseudomonas lundensis]|uniref:hypothetical protein n=1 Tax=Pseudomonas lundensis TaxID=86185 RepID=UPI00088D8502|nr:hypothetical protein [Pseudomonas lundensis]SDQ66486.1 hypothetical protein SAMN04490192_2522 [Pseudomonas lundensis]
MSTKLGAIQSDMSDIGLQGTISSAKRLARYPNTMSTLRENQLLARLFHTLVQNLGLSRTTRELASLGIVVRATYAGTTSQADPLALPFPYDQPSTPLNELKYSAAGNRNHFQLTPSGDEIAFLPPASPGHRWNDNQSLWPVLRDLAVKRLFEIYKADQTRGHLAWVSDLGLAGDLGL